ncbi:hypothetical protein P7K49_021627 [Saguinus oedipus]|uniref:LRAT domain-containing protein n=1 Tax=Saguinus oedipus TaxID=9490 RepID=A0ABQ9UT57_SAGOE|nr:hypothetical protein P7K49_021627 [Saguinus oedipus]
MCHTCTHMVNVSPIPQYHFQGFQPQPHQEPNPGDLIEIFRIGYEHWALYVGDGYVIHLAPPTIISQDRVVKMSELMENSKSSALNPDDPQGPLSVPLIAGEYPEAGSSIALSVLGSSAMVKQERLEDVVGGCHYHVNSSLDRDYRPQPIQVIINSAKQMVGQKMKYCEQEL